MSCMSLVQLKCLFFPPVTLCPFSNAIDVFCVQPNVMELFIKKISLRILVYSDEGYRQMKIEQNVLKKVADETSD